MNVLVSASTLANAIQKLTVANKGALQVIEPGSLQLVKGQIIEAIVQQVAGSTVLLDVDGLTLLARTEIPLAARQQVSLEVTQAGQAGTTLRLLNPSPAPKPEASTPLPNASSNLETLLSSWGLEADEVNLTIAKALLTHSQTINPGHIQTVRQLWWAVAKGQPHLLETLAYLHSSQLPVNEESLALAHHWLNRSHPIAQELADLQLALQNAQAQLQATADEHPALGQLGKVLESALGQLATWSISAGMPPGEIVVRLANLVTALNTPPEAELARHPLVSNQALPEPAAAPAGEVKSSPTLAIPTDPAGEAPIPAAQKTGQPLPQIAPPRSEAPTATRNPLHQLASTIRQALSSLKLDEPTSQVLRHAVDKLDLVSKDLGAIQLSNLGNTPHLATEQHYLFPIPINTPQGPHIARLKVYRRPGHETIDPENVRLALLLDLPGLGEMAISLTVFERYISGQVLSASPQTQQLVAAELAQLSENLNGLGYFVNSLKSDLLPAEEEPMRIADSHPQPNLPERPLSRINVSA